MRRLISAAVFMLICFIAPMAQTPKQQSPGAFSPNLPALITRLQRAVVTIVTYDKDDKPLSRGTGYFVVDSAPSQAIKRPPENPSKQR